MKRGEDQAAEPFTLLWSRAFPVIARYARHVCDTAADAEDLIQCVGERAWRGFATFNGDAGFTTWVMVIARREHARALSRQIRDRMADSSVPAPESAEAGSVAEDVPLRDIIGAAVAAGRLTHEDALVLTTPLDHPDLDWTGIGRMLGKSPGAYATARSRAITRLRVVLFLEHLLLLGGRDAVEAAYRRALTAAEPLTEAEAAAFAAIVLERRASYRRRGWPSALRAACAKVARELREKSDLTL